MMGRQLSNTQKHIFNSAADPVYIVAKNGGIIFANRAASTKLGYNQSDLIKMTVFQIDPNVTRKSLLAINNQLKNHHSFSFKSRHITRKKRTFEVSVHISELKLGTESYFYATAHDITDYQCTISKLEKQYQYENCISMISRIFEKTHDTKKTVQQSLHLLRRITHTDRCYLFYFDEKANNISQLLHACRKGVNPHHDELQNLPLDNIRWFKKQLTEKKFIQIDDIDHLPKAAETFKEELLRESIRSVLIMRIDINQQIYGFVGFDSTQKRYHWDYHIFCLLKTASEMIARHICANSTMQQLKASHARMEQALYKLIETMSKMVEARDPFTLGHQFNVAVLARHIAQQYGLSEQECQQVFIGGIIHDIGKIYIPYEILASPRQISTEEQALIRQHPLKGYTLIQDTGLNRNIKQVVLQHHERYDGSGYPQGLKGDEISLFARIVAVADTVESMLTNRPYHIAKRKKEVIEFMNQNSGILFDPALTKICIKILSKKCFHLMTTKNPTWELHQAFSSFLLENTRHDNHLKFTPQD